MFTVFHTADWHLGQTFLGFDRDLEHAAFLDWLLQQIVAQRPDAMILAGDVFDSINPSAVSQKRYYNFLAAAHAALPSLQMVVTAGNHDAAARLEAPAVVLDSLNITVVGTVNRDACGSIDFQKFLVPLRDHSGQIQAIVLAVPFLRPSDVPLIPEAADPYLDGIREFYRQVTDAARAMKLAQCPDAALIAMGHCHLHGGEESTDSERRLVIGGAEAIGPDTFASDVAYVALGHLHKAQKFDGGRIRYCGSPIPLSFAEAGYTHRLHKLVFNNGRLESVDDEHVPRTVALITIPTSGAELIDDLLPQLEQLTVDQTLPPEQHPFLEVRVLENGPDPTRRKRIEQALDGKPVRLASIKVENSSKKPISEDANAAIEAVDLKTISPEEILLSAHREKYGTEASEPLLKAFREILLQEVHVS